VPEHPPPSPSRSPRQRGNAAKELGTGSSQRRPRYRQPFADGLNIVIFLIAVAIGSTSYAVSQVEIVPAEPAVQWPVVGDLQISSFFGPRVAPCATCSEYHRGVDFTPGAGAPIHAIADGVVYDSRHAGELGVHVSIRHVVDGENIRSVYAHMLVGSVTVNVGQPVERGQTIGLVGSTGESTGPHLHLAMYRDEVLIDPYEWITQKLAAAPPSG